MTERARQMRAIYRTSACQQLAQLGQTVEEARRGGADPETPGAVAQALHVLKGDAALVGMMEIAAALHAVQERAAEGAWDVVAVALTAVVRDLERPDEEPADAPAPAPAPAEPSPSPSWVRLQTDAIDELSNRLLELSTAYNRLAAGLVQAVRDAPNEALLGLAEDADVARRQLDEVLGAAWSLKLASVEDLLQRLAEHAQELARAQGKQLRVQVDGGRVEIERPMLSAIEEPLLQLVRNAVAHGIEAPGARGDKPAEATLVLQARATATIIEIAVEDDGRGISGGDEAAALSKQASLELLFDIGAGARLQPPARGLDAVRVRIEGLGGVVALWSRPGLGTRCVIGVPASLGRERAIVVECAGGVFALPVRSVSARIRVGDHPRRRIAGALAVRLSDGWAPLRGLDEVLGLGAGAATRLGTHALVLERGGRRRAFAVDRVLSTDTELLRRPADAALGMRELVVASSVLGDGRTALWPSVPALLGGQRVRRPQDRRAVRPAPEPRPHRVLVADDSPIVLEVVKSILKGAQLVPQTVTDGEAALQALEQELPDLLVTDVEMPRLDGMELLRRVRERWPHLPVVMLTTRDAEADRSRAMSLGASGYLLKAELDETRLVELVRRLIDVSSR